MYTNAFEVSMSNLEFEPTETFKKTKKSGSRNLEAIP